MQHTITPDHRRFHPRDDLDSVELSAPAQGDFAQGQRQHIAAARLSEDFATGMRTTSMHRVTGDFATGMGTAPRTTTRGDFATGMRTNAAPVTAGRFTSVVDALPIAA